MMRMEDFMRMQQAPPEETPQQAEHHRRLQFRQDRYLITFVTDPGDSSQVDITQGHGQAARVRIDGEGLTIAHFPEDIGKAKLVDEWAEHAWEEKGHATFYSWSQIASVEHWWWIDEEAARKVEDVDRDKPSPYL